MTPREELRARNADALVLAAKSFLTHGPVHRESSDRRDLTVIADIDTLIETPTPPTDTNHDPSQSALSERDPGEPIGRRSHLHGGAPLHSQAVRRLAGDCVASIVGLGRDGEPRDRSSGCAVRGTRHLPAPCSEWQATTGEVAFDLYVVQSELSRRRYLAGHDGGTPSAATLTHEYNRGYASDRPQQQRLDTTSVRITRALRHRCLPIDRPAEQAVASSIDDLDSRDCWDWMLSVDSSSDTHTPLLVSYKGNDPDRHDDQRCQQPERDD